MKKKLLSLVLVMSMILSMFPATVLAAPGDQNGESGPSPQAEEGLPIFFFIAMPGTEPTPTSRYYADYPGYTQGSIKATTAANRETIGVDGIRNVTDESDVTKYIDMSSMNGTLAEFEDFGTKRFDFGWGGSETYHSSEYDIVWVSISVKNGQSNSDWECYCDDINKDHVHIDGVLSKKVTVPDDLVLYKSIPEAQSADQTFTFKLEKLQQDASFDPIDAVDTTFNPIELTATIPAGQTRARISGTNSVTGAFGYYRISEVDENPMWEAQNALYVEIATNGTIKYSTRLNGNYTLITSNPYPTIANGIQNYTITWMDEGGAVLETDSAVPYDTMPSYDGVKPSKEPDVQYHYTFNGWTPAVKPVTGDAVYTATYVPAGTRTYTVTWLNHNADLLETDQNVPYGTKVDFAGSNQGDSYANCVSYGGTTPTKDADHQYTYEFIGWAEYVGPNAVYDSSDKVTVDSVDGIKTYIALFEPHEIQYTATVEVVLNGIADTTNEIVEGGTHKNIGEMVSGAADAIYLSSDGSTYYTLADTPAAPGVYSYTGVPNGNYAIYINVNGNYVRVGTQILTMENADRTKYLPYYSVTYTGGEAGSQAANLPATKYYYIGSSMNVSAVVPTWTDHRFLNWAEGAEEYLPSTALEVHQLDASITRPHELEAQWEDTVKAHVTVVVDHDTRSDAVKEDLVVHLLASSDQTNFNEVAGTRKTFHSTEWYNAGQTSVTTFDAGTYTDLSKDQIYSANAFIGGYNFVKNEVTPPAAGNDTYEIVVYLKYDPEGFDLTFEVSVQKDTPDRFVPASVDVRVTYWDGSAWVPLPNQLHQTMEVALAEGSDGVYRGTGTTHVWAFAGNDVTNPYLYRIELVNLDAIGTFSEQAARVTYAVGMSSTDHVNYASAASGFFPVGAYTGVVTATRGKDAGNGGLTGACASGTLDKPVQSGTIQAVISVKPYQVVLDVNGGTWASGGTADQTIPDRFTVPALDSYMPKRDGYTFEGWYTAASGGSKITGGEYISSYVSTAGGELELYAHWSKNITVRGAVVIDTMYPCSDTSRTTKVALQYRDAGSDNVYVTQREVTVKLTPVANNSVATGVYVFEDVPSIGDYRVSVVAPNGGKVLYQNEPQSVAANNDIHVVGHYNETDYVAKTGTNDPSVAVVNIFMQATPFTLGYLVDASKLGADFWPSAMDLRLYHDHVDGQYDGYEEMTQLAGVTLGTDGVSNVGEVQVPPYHANGYLYDYTVYAQSIQIGDKTWKGNNTETNAPFTVTYTGPANYSKGATPYEQDVMLKVILQPKTYQVNYVLGNGHWAENFVPTRIHTWSHDTNLSNHKPVHDGYMFMGWTADKADNYVDGKIPAAVCEDVTLTAVWEKDENKDDIPDKYQVFVKFFSSNTDHGTVEGTGINQVVTFTDNATRGDVTPEITGVTVAPKAGYAMDIWTMDSGTTPVNPADTIPNVLGGTTITFYAHFAKDELVDPTKDPDPNEPGDEIPDRHQVLVKFVSKNEAQGEVTGTGINQVFTFDNNATSGTVTPSLKNVTVTPKEGYALDIWTRDSGTVSVDPRTPIDNVPGDTTIIFYAHFAEDKLDDHDDNTTDGDDIPDKYQATITYKVENGTWDGMDSAPQIHVFTVRTKNEGNVWTAELPTLGGTIPENMVPANGYVAPGAWDHPIDADTEVQVDQTYTYTFSTVANRELEVEKTLVTTGPVKVGDTITWTITVENTGNVDLTDIVVTDTILIDGAEDSDAVVTLSESGPFNLATTDSPKTITATYTVRPEDAGKAIKNTVVAAADDGTKDEHKPDDTVNVTEQYTVTYSYVNVIDGVEMPALPETRTYNAGDEVTVATAKPTLTGYVFFGWITNDVDATSGKFIINKNVEMKGYFLSEAKISATKVLYSIGGERTKTTAEEGDVIIWEITVTNGGGTEGTYQIEEHLPGAKIYDSLDEDTRQEVTSAQKRTLAGNTSETLYAEYTVKNNEPASIKNTIHINDKEESSTEIPVANLTVTGKTITAVNDDVYVPGTELKVGDKVQWTITVTNDGEAPGTIYESDLVDKLMVKGDDDEKSVDVTYVTKFPVTVEAVKNGTPGTAEIVVEWIVPEDALGATIVNTATLGGDEPFSSSEVKVEDPAPKLEVTKTLADGQATNVEVGDIITWTIKVENTGNVDLTDIVVTDTILIDGAEDSDAVVTLSESGPFNLATTDSPKIITATYIVRPEDAGKAIKNTVVAEADDGTKGEHKPNDTVNVNKLSVTKVLENTGDVVPGDTIQWKITVKNDSTVKLTDIRLTDELTGINGSATVYDVDDVDRENPLDLSKLAFSLQPNKSQIFTAVYEVQPGDVGKEINNKAIASVDDNTTDEDMPEDPVVIKSRQLDVEKTLKTTGPVEVGDTITWTITVTNTGTADLTDIIVTDTILIDGAEDSDAVVTLSESGPFNLATTDSPKTITATYTVRPEDAGKAIKNTVVAEADDGTKGEHKPNETVNVNKLSVTKVLVTTGDVVPGDTIQWKITVKNESTVKLTGINVQDILVINGVEAPGANVTLSPSGPFELDAGKEVEITATYEVQPGDVGKKINNTAVVKVNDKPMDEDMPEDPVVIKSRQMEVKKTLKTTGPVKVGDTIKWTITVTNTGTADLTGIKLTDTLTGAAGTAVVTDDDTDKVVTDADSFSLAADANPKTFTATYEVQPDDVGKQIYNTAEVKDDKGTEDTDTPQTPVTVINRSFTVEKDLVPGQVRTVGVGDTITWTIKVVNTGNIALTGIQLLDEMQNAVGNAVVTDDDTSAEVTENDRFDLPLGGEKTFTAKYVVRHADAGKELNNTVEVRGDDVPTGEDTPNTPVKVLTSGLNVVKTVDKTSAYIGETITWTITVENTGESDLTDIVLTDTLYAEGVSLGNLPLMNGSTNVTKIDKLVVGVPVVLKATYVVTADDAGKTLVNMVVAQAGYPDAPEITGTSPATEAVSPYVPPVAPVVPAVPTVSVNGLNTVDHVAYIIGVGNNEVNPLGTITRAEVANIYFRLMTDEFRNQNWKTTNRFLDVEGDAWYNLAVSTLDAAGVITDADDGYFRPYDPITRAELAVMAAQFAVVNGKIPATSFTDVPANHWAAEEIALVECAGWIEGYLGRYRPEDNLSRAECMTIVNRMLKRGAEDENMLPGLVTFVDNVVGEWYYEAVLEATNSHTYTRTNVLLTGEKFNGEKWTTLLKAPDWAALEKTWVNANSN